MATFTTENQSRHSTWQDVWPFPSNVPRLEGTVYSYTHTEAGSLGLTIVSKTHSDYITRLQIRHINPNINRGDLNDSNETIKIGDTLLQAGEDGPVLERTDALEVNIESLQTDQRPIKLFFFRPGPKVRIQPSL